MNEHGVTYLEVWLFVIMSNIYNNLAFCAVVESFQTEPNLCDSDCAGENSVCCLSQIRKKKLHYYVFECRI